MAFVLRRPFAIPTTLRTLPKPSSSLPLRAFHSTSKPTLSHQYPKARPTTTTTTLTHTRHAFSQPKRNLNTTPTIPTPNSTGSLPQRLLYGAAIIGGAIFATNAVFNRETREDGGMPPHERTYLNDTFLHTGLGLSIIGVAATALHRSGWSYRLMAMNPWIVVGGGLACSIGSMIACRSTSPDNYIPKYAFWAAFNVAQAGILSPLLFMSPALLARAGLYTAAMMGSIAFVGATAKQEKYLYLGGPLLAGCALVAVSGFAPLVLPATAVRSLMWTERVWLWGGLAVFGGFTLWDTQKILEHARMAERGTFRRDAVNESIALELDFINIFVRMVQVLGMQRNNRR